MIKVNAAIRLKAATADPKKAKAYLKSLGVPVTELLGEDEDYIAFGITKGKHEQAIAALREHFGEPKVSRESHKDRYKWKVPGKGVIHIMGIPLMRGHGPYGVYLYNFS